MTVYTEKCARNQLTGTAGVAESLQCLAREWLKNLQIRAALRAERRQLAAMTDAELRDIGLSREQALAEAARRDVPQQRLAMLFRGRG